MIAVRALRQLAVLADHPLVGASRALWQLDLQGVQERAGGCVAHASDMARAPCAFHPVRFQTDPLPHAARRAMACSDGDPGYAARHRLNLGNMLVVSAATVAAG